MPTVLPLSSLCSGKLALRPFALPHILVGLRQPAGQRHHQPDGDLGHRVVEHVGRVGHPDIPLPRRPGVDRCRSRRRNWRRSRAWAACPSAPVRHSRRRFRARGPAAPPAAHPCPPPRAACGRCNCAASASSQLVSNLWVCRISTGIELSSGAVSLAACRTARKRAAMCRQWVAVLRSAGVYAGTIPFRRDDKCGWLRPRTLSDPRSMAEGTEARCART